MPLPQPWKRRPSGTCTRAGLFRASHRRREETGCFLLPVCGRPHRRPARFCVLPGARDKKKPLRKGGAHAAVRHHQLFADFFEELFLEDVFLEEDFFAVLFFLEELFFTADFFLEDVFYTADFFLEEDFFTAVFFLEEDFFTAVFFLEWPDLARAFLAAAASASVPLVTTCSGVGR